MTAVPPQQLKIPDPKFDYTLTAGSGFVLVTTMLITFIYQYPFEFTPKYVTSIILGVVPAIVLWYETVRIWRDRPK